MILAPWVRQPPRRAKDCDAEDCSAGRAVRARELQCAGNAADAATGLLIALRERVRLDEIGRLVDQFVLAIGLGLADTGLGPEVVVLVNTHVAFRRALELHPGRSRRDLVDVEAAGLLGRQLPQPR